MVEEIGTSLAEQSAGVQRGEAVFQALRRAFRDGMYRPGDRLREEEVAQRLGVSRTPVREAFGRLVAKGLVTPAAGRGLIVRSLDAAEIGELYAMREILEGATAGLAAQHASPFEVEALQEIEADFEAATDVAEMARLNLVFHGAIVRAARNRFLDGALQELQDAIALLGPTTFGAEGRPLTAAREHREIVAAIVARDAGGAERVAREHIRQALRTRLRMLRAV